MDLSTENMEQTFDPIDELIGKYLAGEATAEEFAQVELWAKVNEANRRYLDQVSFVFEKASAIKDSQYFDEDAAWNKVKAKLKDKESKTVNFKPGPSGSTKGFQLFWRVAASVIIAIGIGYFVFKNTSSSVKEVIAETKSIGDKLPDGSDVFLNKQTKLVYAYDNKKKVHVVKLIGEAFFNIKHDEKKNFIVETEGIYIRDIGTSFNVKAYADSNTIEVVVKDGIVEFFTDNDSGIFLHAGGKGVYNKATKEFKIEQPETNVLAYKTKFFSFNNQDLNSVVNDLNAVYNKRIIVNTKLKKCRLTVTFNNEDIDEIANVIAETLGLAVTTSGNNIILQGQGCE